MPTGRLIHFGLSSVAMGKRRSWLDLIRSLVVVPFYTPLKLMNDNKGVMGVNIGHLWDSVDLLRPWMQQLVAWYDEALFRPHIDRTYALEKAAVAHHHIQDRKNIGKLLLIP